MTTVLKIFFIVSCIPGILIAQYEEGIFMNRDSVFRYQGIVPPIEFQYDIDAIFNKPIAPNIPDDILFADNPKTIWLRTELLISYNSQTGNDKLSTHFNSSLYEQYLRDSEFDMLRYVLGTVQAGAVGYLAYRHIKKYGFWK